VNFLIPTRLDKLSGGNMGDQRCLSFVTWSWGITRKGRGHDLGSGNVTAGRVNCRSHEIKKKVAKTSCSEPEERKKEERSVRVGVKAPASEGTNCRLELGT